MPMGSQPVRAELLRPLVIGLLTLAQVACVRFTGIELIQAQREIPRENEDSQFSAWPETEWWKAYEDKNLNRLVESALEANPSIELADSRLRMAQSIASYAGATLKPRVDAGFESAWQRYSENGLVPPSLGGSHEVDGRFAVDLRWEIDLFGKLRHAIAATRRQVDVESINRPIARLALASAVASTYFRLAEAGAQREVVLATIEQRRGILKLVEARVALGVDSRVELMQAEGAIARAEEELAATHEQVALLRASLSRIAVVSLAETASLAPTLIELTAPQLPDPIPSGLVARRADIVAAQWRIESIVHGIESVKAEFYPSVNLASFAGFSALGFDDLMKGSSGIYGLVPSVSLPLFDAGRLRAKLGFVTAQGDIAITQYNDTVLNAVQEVIHAITSIRALRERQAAQQKAQAAAETAWQLAMQRYKAGLTGYLTVLSTESEVLRERRAAAALKGRALTLDISLKQALGGGIETTASALAHR